MEITDKEVLMDAIEECAKDEGWANLAEVGVILRSKNIKYGKLSKFILNYSDFVEVRIDEVMQPPVAYARIIRDHNS